MTTEVTEANIRKVCRNVKHGPFAFRSEAVETAKADPLCIAIGAFTLLKSHDAYDYVVGVNNVLFSEDKVQATYQLMQFSGHWRMERAK